MKMPNENEILELVLHSIETALDEHQEHVVFQQMRVAPESLIVHLASFELQQRLQREYADEFDVLLENRRCDLKICTKRDRSELARFEFKIPWSGGFILGETAHDFDKKLRTPSAYEVTVYLQVLAAPQWSTRKPSKRTADEYNGKLRSAVRERCNGLSAALIKQGDAFDLESADGRLRCSVMIWKAEQAD